ncbi:MAG: low molecular weight phosphotyrosine protein phosphatase [Gammaproteobacteria bacterium]|nr:low molecular weight phosphotyrosine protein phosphatase [Gammaproteobacteria bacterium]MBQ0840146.1 low molecular weight phosphotyrosine protein phosphatase [Gammaproteobacteria bacterium]
MASGEIAVLFVCLGNICRSPTAHGVFEKRVAELGLEQQIRIDSAGTGDWHLGKQPDPRTILAAQRGGYDLRHLRARQVTALDFDLFDYILAMDGKNLANLRAMQPRHFDGTLGLFLPFGQGSLDEVPDPYAGGEEGFQQVLEMVERATDGLLTHLRAELLNAAGAS